MSEKTLRQIIDEADDAIQTLRHPEVSEAEERLNEIIMAAKLGDISHDQLAYVRISNGKVNIRTEYSVRGCEQSDDYNFPETILDNEDPIRAATLWGLEKRLSDAQCEADAARRLLSHREEELSLARDALQAILNPTGSSRG
jgi:hypothetical protein